MTEMFITDVIVGERARKDYGDLTDLIESIREHGVLSPIAVMPDHRLLCGGRRVEACRQVGLETIPFVVAKTQDDAVSMLRAERDENTCRKDMTVSERVALAQQIEELEQGPATERQAAGGGARWLGSAEPNQGPKAMPGEREPRSADVAAGAVGMSRVTYQRAKYVMDTAQDATVEPAAREAAQKAVADMDAGTETVTGAQRRVNRAFGDRPDDSLSRKPDKRPPAPPKYGGNRRKHAHQLEALATALSGAASAFEGVAVLDASVTKEEATRLTDDLSKQIRALNRINTLLKERTK